MDLRILAAAGSGVFTRRDALSAGLLDSRLRTLVRAGRLLRIGRDCYVLPATWHQATPEDRYRLRVYSTLRRYTHRGREVVASHHAALCLADLPVWGCDLSVVDTAGSSFTRSRLYEGVRTHPLATTIDLQRDGQGFLRVPAASALVQVLRASGMAAATISADAALRTGAVTRDTLAEAVRASKFSLGPVWLDGLDPAAESVGETRCRLIMRAFGYPVRSQVEIRCGAARYRVDFLIDNVVVEFDGMVKYSGANGREALIAEKRREDDLRDHGYRVLRVVWADLDHPVHIAEKIDRHRRRAA